MSRKREREQRPSSLAHVRTPTKIALLIISTVLCLTLAASPFEQWYLAWLGLVPWLIALASASRTRVAALYGWLAGVLYFALNWWWMWTASIPGIVVLVLYYSAYWALAGGLIHGLGLLKLIDNRKHPAEASGSARSRLWQSSALAGRVFAVAIVWVAVEWLRCNLPPTFPWLPLGATQSPLPLMCQIADLAGPWGVSFWVVLPNALAAIIWIEKGGSEKIFLPAALVAAILLVVAIYGAMRLQTTRTTPGPRVMVLQSNFPHLPGGAPTVDREKAVETILADLDRSLAAHQVDLAVLPEAAFPPINEEARRELASTSVGDFLEELHRRVLEIATEHNCAVLVGGNAVTGWTSRGGERIGGEIRNSAYLFKPQTSVATRYDKIYLVRFSEQAPFSSGPEWLRRIALSIAAPRASQPMHAGKLSGLRPFQLIYTRSDPATNDSGHSSRGNLPQPGQETARFIAPICLENIDPRILASMVRNPHGSGKWVEFLANLSNDGWFAKIEKYQHLQSTVFRCIENRLPMVRSSNTGISGFIDSCGRVREFVAPSTTGVAVRRLELDNRLTLYTRYGDVFAFMCIGFAAAMTLWRIVCLFPALARTCMRSRRENGG